jgi:ABC-2 type transport system permease protein/sodium transport system permease protein
MVYAAAAIGIAARLFGSDAVVHGSRGSWSELFVRPSITTMVPRFDQMALFLAMLFPLYFVLSNLIGQFRESTISTKLILNAIVTGLLFGILPWTYCHFQRIAISSTFRLGWPSAKLSPVFILLALLLATSLWMAAHELFLASRFLGIETLRNDQIESAQKLIAQFRTVSPWLVLFSFALVPAVFEEFFFRGFVYSSLQQLSRPAAILISAVLFGLFHVVVGSVLAIERFLPTTLMGLFLGWLAYRTASIWPGIFLHAAHNGLLLMTAYYSDRLKNWGIGVEEQAHLPITWLITGSIILLLSVGAIELISRSRTVARIAVSQS